VGHSNGRAKGKVTDESAYIKNKQTNKKIPQNETSQINKLIMHLKLLEKQEQNNPKLVDGEK
jgi:hypothetical protein